MKKSINKFFQLSPANIFCGVKNYLPEYRENLEAILFGGQHATKKSPTLTLWWRCTAQNQLLAFIFAQKHSAIWIICRGTTTELEQPIFISGKLFTSTFINQSTWTSLSLYHSSLGWTWLNRCMTLARYTFPRVSERARKWASKQTSEQSHERTNERARDWANERVTIHRMTTFSMALRRRLTAIVLLCANGDSLAGTQITRVWMAL